MSWARLDDAMLDNEKIVAVGPLGFALHVAGILYCARNLTDGFIPAGKVALLLDFGRDKTSAAALLQRLIACKPAPLWRFDAERDRYEINDYLQYNPSKQQVRERQAERAASGQAGGKQSAKLRASKVQAEVKLELELNPSSDEAKSNPVPVPVPLEHSHRAREAVAPDSGLSPMPMRCSRNLVPTPGMLAALEAIGCRDPVGEAQLYVHVSAEHDRREVDWTETGPAFTGYVLRHDQMGCKAARKLEPARPRSVSRATTDFTGAGREAKA